MCGEKSRRNKISTKVEQKPPVLMDWRFLFVREFLISGKDKNHELRYQRMFKKEGAEAARRERPAETGQVAERVVEAAQQGSQERAPADWGGQANIESKSAGVEKAGQPGNSGESGKAFVSEPLAAGRAEPFRACASVETFVFQPNN